MKNSVLLFWLAVGPFAFCARAQDPCATCDIAVVRGTEEHLATLTRSGFECFMGTFDTSCSNNVEYSEYSNEVLFLVLQSAPDLFVKHVQDDREPERTMYILMQLSDPIHDGIQVDDHIRVITAVAGDAAAKERILEALKRAP